MAVFWLLLLAVCLCDYRRRRIPNLLVFLLGVLGLCHCVWSAGAAGGAVYPARCLLSGMCAYPLYRIGAFGAGDVKLFAVCSGCLAGAEILWFFFYSLLFAAIISVYKMFREGNGAERLRYFADYVVSCALAGRFLLYMEGREEKRRAGVCLSGPIALSMLLHLGGIY